jgi:hypothetical protein
VIASGEEVGSPVRNVSLALTLSLLALCCIIERAHAAMANTSISVSATVQASCVAAITPVSTKRNAASTIAVACSNVVPFNVTVPVALKPGTSSVRGLSTGNNASIQSPADATTARVILVVVTY